MGPLDACLCLSDVGKFVESNVAAQRAVKLLGDHAKVEAIISGMVGLAFDPSVLCMR